MSRTAPAAVSISTRLPESPATIRRHLVAVHDRQVTVKHYHVVPSAAEAIERLLSVQGEVHGHALAAQPGADRRGEHFVILYDQQSHPYQHARRTVSARCQPLAPR